MYGRSFTLKDSKCNKPNGVCQFSDGAKAGRCSKASGILNLQEIFDIIDEKKLTPVHDKKAGVKWIHWDNDQWVSYDDDETLMQKREFAASRCLGGMMIWALDQIDQDSSIGGSLSAEEMEEAEAMFQDEAAKGVCYTTMCDEKCRTGDHEAAQVRGQPGALSTMARCPKDQVRRVCCSKGTTMGSCKWRGFRGIGLSCTGGCGDSETEITTNTNHRTKDEDQTCTGGTQSYCCSGFKPPISKEQVAEKFKDEASDLALEAAETLALEIAAKAICRAAIMVATLPLRVIPFVGWVISIALQVAMPALVKVCAKGIAKSGKSIVKFKGKDYEIKPDKPLTTKVDRPASKSPTKAPEKQKTCSTKRLALRADRDVRRISTTMRRAWTTSDRIDRVRYCDGFKAKQACYNYASIIDRRRDLQYLTCPPLRALRAPRPRVDLYDDQHHTDWSSGWMRAGPNLECQRDEYPGASVWQARDDSVWIRLIPQADNGAAAWLFAGCPQEEQSRLVSKRSVSSEIDGCRTYDVWQETFQMLETVIDIRFKNMGNMGRDWGLWDNVCWPEQLVTDDPGYALLTDDPWYTPSRKTHIKKYAHPPDSSYTNGKTNRPTWGYTKPRNTNNNGGGSTPDPDSDSDTSMPDVDDEDGDPSYGGWRRALQEMDNGNISPSDLTIDDGNSTRRPTEEEIFHDLGLLKCEGDHCEKEMEELGFASLPVDKVLATSPATAEAAPTTSTGEAAADATGRGLSESLAQVSEMTAQVVDAVSSVITPAPRPHRHGHGHIHKRRRN